MKTSERNIWKKFIITLSVRKILKKNSTKYRRLHVGIKTPKIGSADFFRLVMTKLMKNKTSTISAGNQTLSYD